MKKFLFILISMAWVILAKAQQQEIIHVNMNELQTELQSFDFDGDSVGNYDLFIITRIGDYMGPAIFRVTNHYWDNGFFQSPWTFNLRTGFGDTISSIMYWQDEFTHQYSTEGALHEGFLTAIRKELPDGDYLYGWLSYQVDAGDGWYDQGIITFHEYAYCTVPNYPLRVGQTSFDWTAVDQTDMHKPTIYPNPTEGVFTVSGEDLKEVEVFNALGQRILTKLVDGSTANIDLESQPAGIYFVNVTDQNGKRCVKKIVKE